MKCQNSEAVLNVRRWRLSSCSVACNKRFDACHKTASQMIPAKQMYAMDGDKNVEGGSMRIPGYGNSLTEQFRSGDCLHSEKGKAEQHRR